MSAEQDADRLLASLASLGVTPEPARRGDLIAVLAAVLNGWREIRKELSVWDESALVNETLGVRRDG